jgi:hypothetical protein
VRPSVTELGEAESVDLQVPQSEEMPARRGADDLEDWGRAAEFLGEPNEEAFRPADVTEPIRVFVLDHFAANELRAVFAESGERLVDVVNSEHDGQVAEGVHRGVPVVRNYRRREKARELEPAVTIRRTHHGDLDALVAESSDSPCPLSFDDPSSFELKAELAKELYRRREVVDSHSATVVDVNWCRYRPSGDVS